MSNYALKNDTIIFYDAAYGDFIANNPFRAAFTKSKARAIARLSLSSFSKNGGFTGVRCAFTVVPKSLNGKTKSSENAPFIRYGRVVQVQNSTAFRIRFNAQCRRFY